MTISCACPEFGTHSSYSSSLRSSRGCFPSSSVHPAMRWPGGRITFRVSPASHPRILIVRASMVDSHENSSEFVKRMEQAWLITQQPLPIACSSCNSNGHVECKWCRGTGFFILGDNMLCEVPSRNTSCVICAGKGYAGCSDCKGTGFRAKWLGPPPPSCSHGAGQT